MFHIEVVQPYLDMTCYIRQPLVMVFYYLLLFFDLITYCYSKTLLRLAISRIKLLRNKRDIQLKQMKRELVQLLQTNQEPSARIRVRKH